MNKWREKKIEIFAACKICNIKNYSKKSLNWSILKAKNGIIKWTAAIVYRNFSVELRYAEKERFLQNEHARCANQHFSYFHFKDDWRKKNFHPICNYFSLSSLSILFFLHTFRFEIEIFFSLTFDERESLRGMLEELKLVKLAMCVH